MNRDRISCYLSVMTLLMVPEVAGVDRQHLWIPLFPISVSLFCSQQLCLSPAPGGIFPLVSAPLRCYWNLSEQTMPCLDQPQPLLTETPSAPQAPCASGKGVRSPFLFMWSPTTLIWAKFIKFLILLVWVVQHGQGWHCERGCTGTACPFCSTACSIRACSR